MFNKKLITLSLITVLSLTACGQKVENKTTTEEAKTTTETTTEVTTPEATTPEATTPKEESTNTPAEPGELASNDTLDTLLDKVMKKFGDDYIATESLPSDFVSDLFGVKAEWYDAGIAKGPLVSNHVDKFLVFHATEGNLKNIQTALKEYQETLKKDLMQYPSNLTKIQGCVVETVGDYVIFSMLGFAKDEEADEKTLIAEYLKMNNEVIDIAKEVINS